VIKRSVVFLFFLFLSFAGIPYWVNYDTNTVWIKTNLTQTTKLYAYYSCSGTQSDGRNVFIAFFERKNGNNIYKSASWSFYDYYSNYVDISHSDGGRYLKLYGNGCRYCEFRYYVRARGGCDEDLDFIIDGSKIRDDNDCGSGSWHEEYATFDYSSGTWYWTGASKSFSYDGHVDYVRIQDTDDDSGGSYLKWAFIRKYYPSLSLSINYGSEETGSWEVEGQTCTKRRQITISSNAEKTDYQVALSYSYFNSENLVFLAKPPKQIHILNVSPEQNFLTQNKTILFNYTVEFQTEDGENASVELWLDEVLIANDTIQNGTITIQHIVNTTYGNHTFTIKAYSQNDTSVYDELSRTFEVYFNITPLIPEPNITLSGNLTVFEVKTQNLYPIICEYYIDNVLVDNKTFQTSGTYNITRSISNGTHTWQVKCKAQDNTNYTKQTDIITFHKNFVSFEKEVQIPVFGNVISTHQRLFFDNKHNLWLLFFVEKDPEDLLYLVRITNDTVKEIASTELETNNLADFFVFLPEAGGTFFDILTFSKNASKFFLIRKHNENENADIEVLEYNTTNISGWSTSITYVFPNSYYDPWGYINLPENYTITDNSFYLFAVKVNTTSGQRVIYLAKKPNNDTPQLVRWGAVYSSSYWSVAPIQTAPLDTNLTVWVAPFYERGSHNRPYIRIALVENNGTSWNFKTSTCEFLNGGNLTSTFGRTKKYLFLVLNNASCYYSSNNNFYIYEANTNKIFSKNKAPAENSFIIFSSDDTFNIFEENKTIAVYFNGSSFNVSELGYQDYGLQVPFRRGEMTTFETQNGIDRVVKGKAILQQNGVFLLYTDRFYDAKFITYDEQEEYRKPFKVQIYTNESISYRTEGEVWGYAIPSELIGGLKKVYITGHTGTKRLYIVGLNKNYLLEAWSLNQDQGIFCSFTVYNQFQIPISDARISALRYSIKKKSWVVVEQTLTDLKGQGYLFLEPFVVYKVRVEGDNYVAMEFDYTPIGSPCQVEVKLNSNGSVIQPMPEYHTLFEDVSYSIKPSNGSFFKQPFNITFTISSAKGKLEWAKMVIIKEFNHTQTTVFNSSITNPTGGVLQYSVNTTGKYHVFVSFKHEDFEEYSVYPKTYWLGLNVGLSKAMEQLNSDVISGWSWFFFSLVVAILVAGFVAQYTVDGAGIMGLIALWILTLIYPSGVVVCLGGGMCITTLTATVLLTLLVGGGLLATKYL
jgi:hypothetical protein